MTKVLKPFNNLRPDLIQISVDRMHFYGGFPVLHVTSAGEKWVVLGGSLDIKPGDTLWTLRCLIG